MNKVVHTMFLWGLVVSAMTVPALSAWPQTVNPTPEGSGLSHPDQGGAPPSILEACGLVEPHLSYSVGMQLPGVESPQMRRILTPSWPPAERVGNTDLPVPMGWGVVASAEVSGSAGGSRSIVALLLSGQSWNGDSIGAWLVDHPSSQLSLRWWPSTDEPGIELAKLQVNLQWEDQELFHAASGRIAGLIDDSLAVRLEGDQLVELCSVTTLKDLWRGEAEEWEGEETPEAGGGTVQWVVDLAMRCRTSIRNPRNRNAWIVEDWEGDGLHHRLVTLRDLEGDGQAEVLRLGYLYGQEIDRLRSSDALLADRLHPDELNQVADPWTGQLQWPMASYDQQPAWLELQALVAGLERDPSDLLSQIEEAYRRIRWLRRNYEWSEGAPPAFDCLAQGFFSLVARLLPQSHGPLVVWRFLETLTFDEEFPDPGLQGAIASLPSLDAVPVATYEPPWDVEVNLLTWDAEGGFTIQLGAEDSPSWRCDASGCQPAATGPVLSRWINPSGTRSLVCESAQSEGYLAGIAPGVAERIWAGECLCRELAGSERLESRPSPPPAEPSRWAALGEVEGETTRDGAAIYRVFFQGLETDGTPQRLTPAACRATELEDIDFLTGFAGWIGWLSDDEALHASAGRFWRLSMASGQAVEMAPAEVPEIWRTRAGLTADSRYRFFLTGYLDRTSAWRQDLVMGELLRIPALDAALTGAQLSGGEHLPMIGWGDWLAPSPDGRWVVLVANDTAIGMWEIGGAR